MVWAVPRHISLSRPFHRVSFRSAELISGGYAAAQIETTQNNPTLTKSITHNREKRNTPPQIPVADADIIHVGISAWVKWRR